MTYEKACKLAKTIMEIDSDITNYFVDEDDEFVYYAYIRLIDDNTYMHEICDDLLSGFITEKDVQKLENFYHDCIIKFERA
jgi:hypothetical protein